MMAMISVILPAYNEENNVSAAADTLRRLLQTEGWDYELILVDDGSADGTWQAILRAAEQDPHVTGLQFSRNFGKEAAMFAGLEAAHGDCCVVMDCDLQHPPEKIPEMVRLWQQGYEVVEGVKTDRGGENRLHTAGAGAFYRLISRAIGVDMTAASDFKLLDRKVVDTLNRMPERAVFFRALSYWTGYKRAEVPYAVRERSSGESKWSTWALIRYAIRNIGSFTSAPLHIVTVLGVLMLLVACVFGAIALIQKFTGQALEGFTTVILLILFSSSLLMICLGIIGYYIARIYDEVKGRPRYIVSRRCGKE